MLMKRKTVKHNRQGLILLVVLSMLALFSLLAMTYVVFSSSSRSASVELARRDYRGTAPDRLLDSALRQVIRGTNDKDSVLWRHSLLEDLYGSLESHIDLTPRLNRYDDPNIPVSRYNGFTPTLPIPVGDVTGPQIFNGSLLKIPLDWTPALPIQSETLTGRILTFSAGPLAGQSFRILRYIGQLEQPAFPDFAALQYTILIDLAEANDNNIAVGGGSRSITEWTAVESNGAALLYGNYATTLQSPYAMFINAGAQNGTGLQVTQTNATIPVVSAANTPDYVLDYAAGLQAPFVNVPDGLLPNHSWTNRVTHVNPPVPYNQIGDTDEPYDAADYNNFFLALRKAAAATSDDIIPSFHRPEVINFLAALDSTDSLLLSSYPNNPTGKQRFMSFLNLVQRATGRPISYSISNFPDPGRVFTNNTQFSGSNSIEATNGLRMPQLAFDWELLFQGASQAQQQQDKFDAWLRWQLRGPWDVDNDNDGVMDSVWTDLNFPLSTSPDGKLLKTLAAIYIEDMDGKIDINASGSLQQAMSTYGLNISRYRYAFQNPNSTWVQGLGFGAGDVYIRHLFKSDADLDAFIKYRYSAGRSFVGSAGIDNRDDEISSVIANQSSSTLSATRPAFHQNNTLPGLPVSTFGRLGIALDRLGNPMLMNNLAAPVLNEEMDDPYEIRLLSAGHSDRRMGIADWERLVRYNDTDYSNLPRNIQKITSTTFSTLDADYLRTVRSISPRNVSLTTPRFARTYNDGVNDRRVASFIEFVESYFQRRFTTGGIPRISSLQIAQLFPIEFQRNRPLDLNRPFGNGLDDNNDGQVDEPQELTYDPNNGNINQIAPYPNSTTHGNYDRSTTDLDPYWDPNSSQASNMNATQFAYFSGNRSRQLFARHLYCLAQLLLPVDNNNNNIYVFPNQPGNVAVDNETRARILAQWAVNVVDYRDADVAMTRFSYDPDPFRNAGGALAPSWAPDGQHVVFGFEQPELLITESLATHDIRARRRPTPNDDQWDQLRLPEGSLFLEFYAPRTTATDSQADHLLPGVSPSLYRRANPGAPIFLDLNKAVSDGTNVYPVWRVVITKPADDGTNPIPDSFTRVFDGDDEEQNTSDRGLSSFNYSYHVGFNTEVGIPWRTSMSPTDVESNPSNPIPAPVIDRVLWFADVTPTDTNAALPASVTYPRTRIYKYREGNNQVQGGQYLVVGPRPITYFGSKRQPNAPLDRLPNNHRISLLWTDPNNTNMSAWNWVQIWNQDNQAGFYTDNVPPRNNAPPAPAYAQFIPNCVTMVAGANLPFEQGNADFDDPMGWGPTLDTTKIKQTYIGLNISEPTPSPGEYYPKPTIEVNATNNTRDPDNDAEGYRDWTMDGYIDASVSPPSGTRPVFDADPSANPPTSPDPADRVYFLQQHRWPRTTGGEHPRPGTRKNWSTAVLQRLADPDRVFHAVLNPYITIDWHSIDLTVFSGEDNPMEQDPYYFNTRAKSGRHSKVTMNGNNYRRQLGNLGQTFYSYETSFPSGTGEASPVVTPTTRDPGYFGRELISENYEDANLNGQPTQNRGVATSRFTSLGYLNRSYNLLQNSGPPGENYYLGAPATVPDAPYHANRNFINSLELSHVTLSSNATFAQDFFFEVIGGNPPLPRHRHVLDFETLLRNNNTDVNKSLTEIFEVTSVGSPWPDAWHAMAPASATPIPVPAVGDPNRPRVLARNAMLSAFTAPMNLVPTFREPGKVNLNTVTDDLVMHGLMGNIMPILQRNNVNATVPYRDVLRQNTVVTPNASVLDARHPGQGGNPNFNGAYPTTIPGVLTSPSAAQAFPLPALRYAHPIDATLLKRQVGKSNRIFNVDDASLNPHPLSALFPGQSINQPINNTFTYNYPAVRLGNITTDRSQVYSVRITLGFFEYDPASGIGHEYGRDQGRASRPKAFYLIDRSIPVGFQPGMDFNTDNVILSRRIVQ